MTHALLWAAAGTGFTALMTAAGAAVVFFFRGAASPVLQRIMLGFAAGVMIASSMWSLLIPAIETAQELGLPGWLPAAGGSVLGIVFLLAMALTLPGEEERRCRAGACWLVPAVCLPQFALYVTHGDILFNVLMCGMTMLLAWCALRGLVWAGRSGDGRLRPFHRAVLAFTVLEYALWTSSCFWVGDTLANPYFWFDFLLSLVLLLLLPAAGKAVAP